MINQLFSTDSIVVITFGRLVSDRLPNVRIIEVGYRYHRDLWLIIIADQLMVCGFITWPSAEREAIRTERRGYAILNLAPKIVIRSKCHKNIYQEYRRPPLLPIFQYLCFLFGKD